MTPGDSTSDRDAALFFLTKDEKRHIASHTPDNAVEWFTDDRVLFKRMLADLLGANGASDFVYFTNWWCDLDVPLGDPASRPVPPTLREVLKHLASPKPVGVEDASPVPARLRPTKPGTQICALVWQIKSNDKNQLNRFALMLSLALGALGYSMFGGDALGALNSEAVSYINGLDSDSAAILDDRTLAFGSHHQKLLVIGSGARLIAYCGSADFNADRLYRAQARDAAHPPTTKGAPLSDVSIRIEGPAAATVLETFLERWRLHPDGKMALRGASFPLATESGGPYLVQVTHTYGRGYPYRDESVRSAADALLHVISLARVYIYWEDQYLVGTPELLTALRSILQRGEAVVVCVMAPQDVVGDLPGLAKRRSIFWGELVGEFPERVRLFERLGDGRRADGAGSYLHAKLTIVDDEAACVGTVNCSRRSWGHDSEILATIAGRESQPGPIPGVSIAAQLRVARWAEHLNMKPDQLNDLTASIPKWSHLSSEARVRAWLPKAEPVFSATEQLVWDRVCDPV